MAAPIGPKKVHRYTVEFKIQAVRLSLHPDIQTQDVAKALDIQAMALPCHGDGSILPAHRRLDHQSQPNCESHAASLEACDPNLMEKLSAAYIVALATRSADSWLMQDIQNHIPEEPRISCPKCRDATIGLHVIRGRLFPRLKQLRKHANNLIHHLDKPENRGVDGLNIQGVFEYCYHLFQENADALFRHIPSATFRLTLCKSCKAVRKL